MTLQDDLEYINKRFPEAPTSESDIQWAIRYVLGRREDLLLLRNQSGATQELGIDRKFIQAIYNELCSGSVSKARERLHNVLQCKGRHITYGLGKGSPDLVGILKPTGRWLAIEVKSSVGRIRPEQQQWLRLIESFGGVAGVARSVSDGMSLYQRAKE